jgi:hypothetical protein
VVQTADADTASALLKIVTSAYESARKRPDGLPAAMEAPDAFFRAITPKLERDRLTLSLDEQTFHRLLLDLLRSARAAEKKQATGAGTAPALDGSPAKDPAR